MLFLKNILEKRGVFNVCGREKNELAPFESSLPPGPCWSSKKVSKLDK